MAQRFCVTPPELSPANGNLKEFLFTRPMQFVRINSTFMVQVSLLNQFGSVRQLPAGTTKINIRTPGGESISGVRVSLPSGWTTLAQFASMHGWCVVEGYDDDTVVQEPLNPWDMQPFRWNIHTTLTTSAVQTSNIMVEGITGIETAAEHNGRIPDLLYLNHVSLWTHEAPGDTTPVTLNVQTVALQKIPTNPVGIPEDTFSAFALAAPNAIGTWGYSFAGPLPFPLRSMFRSYGAGDTTPSVNLVLSHASAPADITVTVQMHCTGMMIP